MAVGAAPGNVIAAFDQVASALGERYLLTFPAPTRLPATAALRVETGNGSLTSEIAVPAAPRRPQSGATPRGGVRPGGAGRGGGRA